MTRHPSDRNPSPLDAAALQRLALAYVGRYATTRAKLRSYLERKLHERGWNETDPPPTEALIARFTALGYVDDRQYAESRAAALGRRGYGARRVGEALRAAGIGEGDAATARAAAADSAWEAAIIFARRRRIGPFAKEVIDDIRRRRAFAAMLRAGHSIDIIRKIMNTSPDDPREGDGPEET